jgi:hypothetical protein
MNWRGGGIKRDKYDDVFSDLVRERADWVCERCGRNYRHEPEMLDCSHVNSRGITSVRTHKDNAFAHCKRGCHEYFEQHPLEFADWVRSKIGQRRYDRLILLANKPTKFTHHERELQHKHYLNERRRLKALRLAGVIGRIEFTMVGEAETKMPVTASQVESL